MCRVNKGQTKTLESVILGKYIWGMDNQIYIDGPDMLHGKFLIHAARRTRIFITGSRYVDHCLYWDTWKEYPAKPKYYMTGSVVLTDIELDQCPKWKEKAIEITKEHYEKSRIHQST